MLNESLRSRWFAALLHSGMWLLLILAITAIGGRKLPFHEAESDQSAVSPPIPVAKMGGLFDNKNWPRAVVDPVGLNPFATTHFMPPVVPVVPPTTRRIEITYQGFYEPVGGPRNALLRVGDALVGVKVGGMVVTNLFVAQAEFKTLMLTNSAQQTNVLSLNAKKEVEVPLK